MVNFGHIANTVDWLIKSSSDYWRWLICYCRSNRGPQLKIDKLLKEKEKKENMVNYDSEYGKTSTKSTKVKEMNISTLAANYGEEQLEHAQARAMTRDAYEKKEREALIERIKAMDAKQLAIVAECIPVEVCLDRIAKEYGMLKAFRDSVKNTIGNFN